MGMDFSGAVMNFLWALVALLTLIALLVALLVAAAPSLFRRWLRFEEKYLVELRQWKAEHLEEDGCERAGCSECAEYDTDIEATVAAAREARQQLADWQARFGRG